MSRLSKRALDRIFASSVVGDTHLDGSFDLVGRPNQVVRPGELCRRRVKFRHCLFIGQQRHVYHGKLLSTRRHGKICYRMAARVDHGLGSLFENAAIVDLCIQAPESVLAFGVSLEISALEGRLVNLRLLRLPIWLNPFLETILQYVARGAHV